MDTALPVFETAAKLRKKLIEEEKCDLVIPMTHQVCSCTKQTREYAGTRTHDGCCQATALG